MVLLFPLLGEDHLDELLVVDVALGVLLAVDEALDLLLVHLLAERGQHVTELRGGDVTRAILKAEIRRNEKMIEQFEELTICRKC